MKDSPFLDRTEEIIISTGDILPHWHQSGKIQFVTFRLADSLPQVKIIELKSLISNFERQHPKPWDETIIAKYHKIIGPRYERLLDNGYGDCILKGRNCQEIIKNSIFFYNDNKYNIIAFVIMPNHVHILLKLNDDYRLGTVIQSIKRHTAREINKLLVRKGAVWMKGYFDRIVRSEDHLKHYINYIINNPRHSSPGEFYLFVN